jgi:hypothetical protein
VSVAVALCLGWLGTAPVRVETDRFQLSWTHSVQQTRWTEEWSVTAGGLVAVTASVEGSGAGMEVPDGAVRDDGGWRWTPDLPPQPRLVLAASEHAPDHTLCAGGVCRPLKAWLGKGAGPVELRPCPGERRP